MPFSAAVHGKTAVAADPEFTATGSDQEAAWSDDIESQTVWASDQAANRFPFAGSTARAGKMLLRAVNNGAWKTRVGVHVAPLSVLRDTKMLLKLALVPFWIDGSPAA